MLIKLMIIIIVLIFYLNNIKCRKFYDSVSNRCYGFQCPDNKARKGEDTKSECIEFYLVEDGIIDCQKPDGISDETKHETPAFYDMIRNESITLQFDPLKFQKALFLKIRRVILNAENYDHKYMHVWILQNDETLTYNNIEITIKRTLGRVTLKKLSPYRLVDSGLYSVIIHDSIEPMPTYQRAYFRFSLNCSKSGKLSINHVNDIKSNLLFKIYKDSTAVEDKSFQIESFTSLKLMAKINDVSVMEIDYLKIGEDPTYEHNKDYLPSHFCLGPFNKLILFAQNDYEMTMLSNKLSKIKFKSAPKTYIICDYDYFSTSNTYQIYSNIINVPTRPPIIIPPPCVTQPTNNLLVIPTVITSVGEKRAFCSRCGKVFKEKMDACVEKAHDIVLDESKMPYELLHESYSSIYVSHSTILLRRRFNLVDKYEILGYFDFIKRSLLNIGYLKVAADKSFYQLVLGNNLMNQIPHDEFHYFLITSNSNGQLISSIKLRKYKYKALNK